jgi:hypothetical protein
MEARAHTVQTCYYKMEFGAGLCKRYRDVFGYQPRTWCDPGSFNDGSSCRMCPYGKFQPPKSLSVAPECTSCPAGTTSDGSQEGGMRMTSVDHCYYSRVIRRRWSRVHRVQRTRTLTILPTNELRTKPKCSLREGMMGDKSSTIDIAMDAVKLPGNAGRA